jgi:carbamate kinase
VSKRYVDRWVIAIGGNALADPREPAALTHQQEHANALAAPIVDVLAQGVRLVIVHGNGPQVGARLIQSEAGRDQVPPAPLHVCVAETQAEIGHYLALAIANEAVRRNVDSACSCVVSHVLVDPGASEFQRPDKPVGPTYAEDEAEALGAERGWQLAPVAGKGWRRVVPSPRPTAIMELTAIEALVRAGTCVIAGGGGGVPIARSGDGFYPVDAVVDKDYTAELIATALGASRLFILTDVPGAALGFLGPEPQFLPAMSVGEARSHLTRNEFAPGSMGPKVEACAQFVQAGGETAVIAAIADAAAALQGRAGTRILPGA